MSNHSVLHGHRFYLHFSGGAAKNKHGFTSLKVPFSPSKGYFLCAIGSGDVQKGLPQWFKVPFQSAKTPFSATNGSPVLTTGLFVWQKGLPEPSKVHFATSKVPDGRNIGHYNPFILQKTKFYSTAGTS